MTKKKARVGRPPLFGEDDGLVAKQVTFRRSHLALVDAEAERRGVSRSEVVREAIEQYVARGGLKAK